MYAKHGTAQATPPFDFVKSLDYLRRFPPAALDQLVTDDYFIKAFRLDGQTFIMKVTGGTDDASVAYDLYSQYPLTDQTEAQLAEKLRAFLGLDDDLAAFYYKGKDDQRFAPILHDLFGYHPIRFSSAFEAAAWAILSQRNRMATARNMYRDLVRRFSDPMEIDGNWYSAFPEPQEIAVHGEGEVSQVARNLRRGEFLVDAARAFSVVSDEFLREATYPEVYEWLRSISGIGPRSAGFILLRGLGRPDCIPLLDRVMVQAVSQVYGGGSTLSDPELQKIASHYGRWQGYWAHYLRVAL